MAEADDEAELAKWLPICDDCHNPVEYYCTTCRDKLCTGCKDQHLSRRRNRDHQVVVIPYSAGKRAAQKSTSTCINHPGEKYLMYCKTCQSPVCTPCVTQSHSGHDFISITDAFSNAKEKAIANLEELTKKIRPRMKDYCEWAKKSEDKALQNIDAVKKEMISRKTLLYEMVDNVFEGNMKQLTDINEKYIAPFIVKQKEESDSLYKNVEKTIKDYENKLLSTDPVHLITFMKEKGTDDLPSFFPVPAMKEVPLPKFQAVALSQESIQGPFGSVIILKSQKETPKDKTQKWTTISDEECATHKKGSGEKEKVVKDTDTKEGENKGMKILTKPEKLSEFTFKDVFSCLCLMKYTPTDKMWISARGRNIFLIDRNGSLFRKIDVKCPMTDTSGMCCTNDGELILCDRFGQEVKKVSCDFRATTLFVIGSSEPRGLCQLKNGACLVCMADDGVLRVYDEAGKVVREIGKGHLQSPYYVAVNKINDDICVSDNYKYVVVFRVSGEKRYTYTGNNNTRSEFSPRDLGCDQLGNILITDCTFHRVHIIDREGHFLQYLVSGEENISFPIAIDIDSRGYAWVGEYYSTAVKIFKYFS